MDRQNWQATASIMRTHSVITVSKGQLLNLYNVYSGKLEMYYMIYILRTSAQMMQQLQTLP